MQTSSETPSGVHRRTPIVTLRDLLALTPAELDELYASASVPAAGELDGDYDGLLLSGQFPPRPAFRIGFVNRRWLPWRGKAFSSSTRRGANRIRVGRRKLQIWSFETRIVPSRFGGDPTLLIGYAIVGNAYWLRHGVFDELRRLRDGLYLGKGGLCLRGKPWFVFHWALAPA